MKAILASLVFLFLVAPSETLQDIRLHFQRAEKDKEAANTFNELMQKDSHPIDKHIRLAYYGASITLVAKHGTNIAKKISLFKEGRDIIEEAVKNSPNNTEIRLVRLMIQSNAPAILGYRSNISSDKELIIKNFKKSSEGLQKYISDIARDTDIFTAEEKLSLK